MHQLSVNLFWLLSSQAFGMDIETTKIQLTTIGNQFDSGEDLPLNKYSNKITEIIMFYLENKKHLQC